MGYTAALDTTVTETADGDYDTQPNLLRDTSVGIRAAPGDVGHLAVDQSVVCSDGSCVGAQFEGRRIRPSASDLFGIAKVNNFTNIDLQRQDFIGGAEWHLAANWEGNTIPDSDDIVGVRHDGFVVITDGPAATSTLIVCNDSDLIADNVISVAKSITVESSSSLTIATGGFTNLTTLRSNDSLDVTGGTYFSSFVNVEAGSVTIDGATLDSSFPTVEQGSLRVINSGFIDSSIATIGDGFGTNQATATVDGFNSSWNNTSTLTVGDSAQGTLEILNGASVSNTQGTIGRSSGRQGTVIVRGSNSTWTNSSELFVADEGQGTLNIEDGGDVTNTQGFVGNQADSSGEVTVTGSGSTWTNSEFIVVGFFGDGSLSVFDGGQVLNPAGSASIGNRSDSMGTVLVDGASSSWTNDFTFFVGFEGNGQMTIQNGGSVSNTGSDTTIALMEGSEGTVLVDGARSSWMNDVLFSVGGGGTAELTIQNGGSVSNNGSDTTIALMAGSDGTVLIDGAGSSWMNDALFSVGGGGTAELTIQNGGSVSNTGSETIIALMAGSDGTVLVDGAGSSWTNDVLFTVGAGGTAELTIQNGGSVSNTGSQTLIGGSSGSNGTVTVDGTDSEFDVSATPLLVGVLGTGNLNVENGGAAHNAEATVGDGPLSRGTVTVEGAGSTWTSSGNLILGDQGFGNLNILDGGVVMNGFARLSTAGDGGRATISGAGSTWNNQFDLVIGTQFNTGFMTIADGGTVNSNLSVIGFTNTARGVVEVTDPDSTWTNSSSLSIGQEGEGELTISDGGSVSNTFGFIGFLGGQATVTVDGEGSSWTSSDRVFVGVNGVLNIQNGGDVESEETMFIDGGTVTL